MDIEKLTQKELKRHLHYDPNSGEFKRKTTSSRRVKVGDIAGYIHSKGYRIIRVNGRQYPAHRLAWLYMKGAFPIKEVDHINHNRADNRFSNLRVVTRSENQRNASISKKNVSGFTGVYWDNRAQRWFANIKENGRAKHIGRFTQLSDAVIARVNAEIAHGYHPNHGASKLKVDTL